jgi:hypothetical protein
MNFISLFELLNETLFLLTETSKRTSVALLEPLMKIKCYFGQMLVKVQKKENTQTQ